ncbi:hypothetical protein JAAARDRAFT_82042 [Jaapia argillacea MUCL 33604]|uniref:Protein kinase domain-containing protein n=1 Tax=Jaapia argillacea MUCL 33604 TaxID=933084 RepID=A0A067P5J5_9AGAM|nr:hypothetical protein JAAARDRAFT_82042 [Jaapia argillacea MUCL 33604]
MDSPDLPSRAAEVIEEYSRFRILVIGTTGVGKSTLINRTFNVDLAKVSEHHAGKSNIDDEITSPDNPLFVLHDSQGLEPGDVDALNKIKDFVKRRMAEPKIKDRLHAIWLCIEVPRAGGRLFETGTEELLQLMQDTLPIVVVFTKFDLLLLLERNKLRGKLSKEEIAPEAEKQGERFLEEHCKEPLARLAPNTSCVKVSRYWDGLCAKAIAGQKGFMAFLDAVHTDMVSVWNFNDPQKLLSGLKFKGMVLGLIEGLAPDNAATTSDNNNIASILQAISTPTGAAVDVVGLSSTFIKLVHDTSQMTPETLKCLMAYIVDLIAILENLLLVMLAKRSRPLTWEDVDLAFESYRKSTLLSTVHQDISDYTTRPHVRDVIDAGNAEKEMNRLVRLLVTTLPPELLAKIGVSSKTSILGNGHTVRGREQTTRPAESVTSSVPAAEVSGATTSDSRGIEEASTFEYDDGGPLDLGNSVVIVGGPIRGGGFSDVYRGVWDHQGQKVEVAMKKLRVYLEHNGDCLKLFRHEVKIWSRMNHPYILQFLGFTVLDGSFFCMISPWVHNGDCLRYLKLNPNADRVKLLSQTAQALHYLHSGKSGWSYVHGDLKGDNVLVSEEGNALLADFGLTRHLEKLSSHSMTPSRIPTLGLAQFAAPELFLPETRPTARSDVYAFGCLIVQIFTGELPFPTMSDLQIMMAKIQRGQKPSRPRDPALVVAGLDDRLWGVVERCVDAEPLLRPTMNGVVQMLG